MSRLCCTIQRRGPQVESQQYSEPLMLRCDQVQSGRRYVRCNVVHRSVRGRIIQPVTHEQTSATCASVKYRTETASEPTLKLSGAISLFPKFNLVRIEDLFESFFPFIRDDRQSCRHVFSGSRMLDQHSNIHVVEDVLTVLRST